LSRNPTLSIATDKPEKHVDLEIKDAGLIFSRVWAGLEAEYGRQHLLFPGEIIWLGGAPGAGKGTNTAYIMEARGITASPLVVSDLLDSPRARRIKEAGGLVGDEDVCEILLRRLLDPVYQRGVIVDGFPRTQVQVECLKMFYDHMNELREAFRDTTLAEAFPRPRFHSVLLFVDEEVSVRRQIDRGKKAQEHNRRVQESGVGVLQEIRATDLDPEAARNRYRLFKETTYGALRSLRQIFPFHFIDADKSLEEVQAEIEEEFSYQSSLELDHQTFDRIRVIPPAGQITLYARQELVRRLETYNKEQPELFQRVIDLINQKFMPIVTRYAITGLALVNSEDRLFEEFNALAMAIDVFSDRGYQALVDVNRVEVPARLDPETHAIICTTKRVYRFQIRFSASAIRRGSD
jgi:adenylate kinase